MKNYELTGRIWLSKDGETILGSGKVTLLQHIEKFGSLRRAASEMKMSYRKAWYSIKQINLIASEPVVVLQRGGKDGGKAFLTKFGTQLLQDFSQQQLAFQEFLNTQNKH